MITLVGDGNKTALVVFQLAEKQEKVPEMKHFCLLCKPSRKMLRVRQQLIPPSGRAFADRQAGPFQSTPWTRETCCSGKLGATAEWWVSVHVWFLQTVVLKWDKPVASSPWQKLILYKPYHSSDRDDGSKDESWSCATWVVLALANCRIAITHGNRKENFLAHCWDAERWQSRPSHSLQHIKTGSRSPSLPPRQSGLQTPKRPANIWDDECGQQINSLAPPVKAELIWKGNKLSQGKAGWKTSSLSTWEECRLSSTPIQGQETFTQHTFYTPKVVQPLQLK